MSNSSNRSDRCQRTPGIVDALSPSGYDDIKDVGLKSLQPVTGAAVRPSIAASFGRAENRRPLALLFRTLTAVEDDSEPDELPSDPRAPCVSMTSRSKPVPAS